jgi:hypothetical protein
MSAFSIINLPAHILLSGVFSMRVLRRGGQTLYVWRNVQLVKSRLILFFALLALAFMLFTLNVFPYASVGLIMVPVAYGLGIYSYKSYLAWQGGSFGEESVTEALMSLDDSYTLLNGLVVPPNRGDTDHIVIGPNGFFVVESKNYGGRISCEGDVWKKTKVGKGGVYNLEIGSPSNQLKRNAKVLKDFLLEHQEDIFGGRAPHLWVHGVLVFTNPDAELELNSPTVDIVDLDDLRGHIMSSKSEFALSPDMVVSAGRVLLRYAC